MKKINLILCGLGGQGVLFLTKIISITAIKYNYNVLAAETHGMAQRGGSVISHLIIGKSKLKTSLINIKNADFILSLNESETYRNLPFLNKGGKIYSNISTTFTLNKKIKHYLYKQNIKFKGVMAESFVQKLSLPLSLNLTMLNYFFSFENNLLNKNSIRETIENISPQKFKKINIFSFDESYNFFI